MDFVTVFDFGDRVVIDGDHSLVCRVLAFTFRHDRGCVVEVSWVHNGVVNSDWVDSWRLSPAEAESDAGGDFRLDLPALLLPARRRAAGRVPGVSGEEEGMSVSCDELRRLRERIEAAERRVAELEEVLRGFEGIGFKPCNDPDCYRATLTMMQQAHAALTHTDEASDDRV